MLMCQKYIFTYSLTYLLIYLFTLSAKILNDLSKISEWTHRWKMLFNPDITKQTQEVIFSRKNTKNDHPIVYFNEAPVVHTTCQKHLGMPLDEKLNY